MRILASIFLGLFYAVLITVPAKADPGAIFDTQNRAFFSALSGNKLVLGTESTDNVVIRQNGTDTLTINGTTGNVSLASGSSLLPPTYVPTMAATAVAVTNQFVPGSLNVIPTAAANTVAMTKATPVVGESYLIYNSNGTNAVRLKPGGATAINGGTAGAYVELAAGKAVHCLTVGAAALRCYDLTAAALPTPAGP